MIARTAPLLLAIITGAAAQPMNTVPEDRRGVAKWENDPRFPDDTFRFVRLRPEYHPMWATDYPDSDLNFSFRLQQMTSIKVHPDPLIVDTMDPKLKEHPFLYLIEAGHMQFRREEAQVLREHLLNGGFLMFDDFWGDEEWENVAEQVKMMFPDRPITELELDHPIFNIVFPIKEKPQVPSIDYAMSGRTYEKGGSDIHYYGVFDEKGRMMIVICRNTDLGDGWEREGENHYYFKEFSEKKAYPMGINIIVYSMTH